MEGQIVIHRKDDSPVWETRLPLKLHSRGKVRDIYEIDAKRLLIITTDRLSAFDVVLPTPISGKGKVLNQISLFWFDKFKNILPNHVITADISKMGFEHSFVDEFGAQIRGRSILVHRAKPMPVECVVRGFLAGSGWSDYQKTGKVCGHVLPAGLKQCQELSEPLFTPATKAVEGHDENISFDETVKLVSEPIARQLRDLSIHIYKEGVAYAKTRGILIADTKFEFGLFPGATGKDELMLIDEVLTPDSSRFWPSDTYKEGRDQASLDKQIVRNYLTASGWAKTPPGPVLPKEIAEETGAAYKAVFKTLTGRDLE